MSDQLISREALKEFIYQYYDINKVKGILNFIDNAPTVEETVMVDKSNFSKEQYNADLQSAYDCGYESGKNERPQGEWIAIDAFVVKCSVCGVESFATPFCPKCGLKMKGGVE